ncbi:esterase/lipase family protein [Williamsia serinedens]|uniref:Triacylglycerol esterase/lipase EstA, alpha/beta hydrolase fold n=1 Tax=Williamsia serinedens TaxID=391736 RepID=A0ABT1H503_9NOCA|nr:lipase family protein [Williamsia serinedens]MCP2162320.1 Triacylglycerol esterase/lipase EstA, alpha/beta hydrolase fold [Williamsia serinedens]
MVILRRVVLAVTVAVAVVAGPTVGAQAAPLPVAYDFFSGVGPELAHPGGSLPGSNDFACRPSPEHPDPVILVHGTGGSRQTNWGTYVPLLKNAGYCVFALTYGALPGPWPITAIGGMGPMRESARQFGLFAERVLAATGAARVDVVGHSQGTLIPALWVKSGAGAGKIGRYVSLAALWDGTSPAGAGSMLDLARQRGLLTGPLPVCAACGEFDPNSPTIRGLHAGGLYDPGITYTNIATIHDEAVVPYTSGLVPGGANVTNIVVQDGCPQDLTEHAGLAGSRRAATFVLNALDPVHPRPAVCERAAPFTGSRF